LGHEVSTDLFSLCETTIAKILRYTEDPENHCLIGRTATRFAALERCEGFAARGKDLDAILLRHNGQRDESLVGIRTLYDLPKILEILGFIKVFDDLTSQWSQRAIKPRASHLGLVRSVLNRAR
jgi:hypothetical protein